MQGKNHQAMDQEGSQDDDQQELNEEEIVEVILKLGNEVLKNVGVEEQIDDVSVFFSDAFYIQFFMAAFPELDFSQLEEAQNEEEMAENIQALIDVLGQQILKYDLSHIRGDEIVNGNPEHCINLLQLVLEISNMLENKIEGDGGEEEEIQVDDEGQYEIQKSNQKKSEQKSRSNQKQQMRDEVDIEDQEAEIIAQGKSHLVQQSSSNKKQDPRQQPGSSQKASSQKKKGRSYSDDRGMAEFGMDDDDYGDQFDDGHLVEVDPIRGQNQMGIKPQQLTDEEDDEEGFDDDELKMYEQFLANQQDEQRKQLMGGPGAQAAPGAGPGPEFYDQQEEEFEDDDEEEDLEGYPPELVEAARQMGLNAQQIKELQKQLQMQEGEDYGDEMDEQSYYSEGEMQTRMKLIRQKSYSAPYILMSDCFNEALYDTESQILQKACSETMLQGLELKEGSDDEAAQAQEMLQQQQQQEILIQEMMIQQQQMQQQKKGGKGQDSKITEVSKSKESSSYQHKGYNSNNQRQNMEQEKRQGGGSQEKRQSDKKKQQQQQQQQAYEEDEDEMDIDLAEKLKQLQEKDQQMLQQEYGDEDEYGEEDDEAQQIQQQQQFYVQNNQQANEEEDEEGDDGEDKTMIDLDDLDDNEREMLLQYLQQEYEKNPDQFPFPQEFLEKNLKRSQGQKKDEESIRDIKSQEMVVEDAQTQNQNDEYVPDGANQIIGGGQEVEDDQDEGEMVELTEEQQQQLQYLLQQQQLQEQQQIAEEAEEYDQAHMKPQFAQKKAKKGKGTRPKSGKTRANKKLPQQQQQQQQFIDAENIDPNLLQQIIMAQSQQQMMQQQQAERPPRPVTGKKPRPFSGKKQKNLKQLQTYSMAGRGQKFLHPSTPGNALNKPSTRSMTQSKKKTKKRKAVSSKRTLEQPTGDEQQQQVQIEGQEQQFPLYNEEFLNQLTEDQLQQLLNEQQQMMLLQQLQQQQQQQQQLQQYRSGKKVRPKSGKRPQTAKSAKPKTQQSYGSYSKSLYPANMKRKWSANKNLKKKKKKQAMNPQMISNDQGIMMNNYFPALENQHMGGPTQNTEEGASIQTKDSRYPKFGNENINNPNYGQQMQQDPIAEVPPEQEEGESQDHLNHQFFHPQLPGTTDQGENQENTGGDDGEQDDQQPEDGQQQQQDQDQDQNQEGGEEGEEEIELTEEQLIQLIQNAHNLSPEQQAQLQVILQEKIRATQEQYGGTPQNLMNIQQVLVDNIQRAKDRYAGLGFINSKRTLEEDTDQRILKQKMEFDTLLKEYLKENMSKENRRTVENAKLQKNLERESKMQSIREKKFEEELALQQKSIMYKRNAQQVELCQRVYKLASELEKEKLLQEKREFKETQERKKAQKKMMVDAIETYYKDRIQMLKDRIRNERFERQIAQQAQSQALSKMKKELNNQKKQEIQKYLQLLKQEDQKYDVQSNNMNKLEKEILKMYKR